MLGETITHLSEHPRQVDSCTAAGEQEVVVVFVLPRGRSLERCAFDGQNDGRVVRGDERVSPKAVRVALPAEREAL